MKTKTKELTTDGDGTIREMHRSADATDITDGTDKKPDLELLAQADAQTERKIEMLCDGMQLALRGFQSGLDLTLSWMVVAGTYANRLAELAGHGRTETLLGQKFPGLSRSRLHRFRQLAEKLQPHISKVPLLGFLTAPTAGKKNIPAKSVSALNKVISEQMDGRTLMKYLSDWQPKPDGGFRPDGVILEAWLREHHPALAETAYDDLPKEVQDAFRKQYRPATITPDEAAAGTREDWQARAEWIDAEIAQKSFTAFGPEAAGELKKIQQTLHDANGALLYYLQKLTKTAKRKESEQEGTEGTEQPLIRFMAIQTAYAFEKGLKPVIRPHDMGEIVEACNSPSVAGIIRLIEARNIFEAEAIATRKMLGGEMEKTFGCPGTDPKRQGAAAVQGASRGRGE